MRHRKLRLVYFAAYLVVSFCSSAFGKDSWKEECALTRNLKIYSNAYYSEEGGDVVGYELAIEQHKDLSMDVYLFVYEGAPRGGVHLLGRITGNKVKLEGSWTERLSVSRSQEEISQKLSAKVSGILDPQLFTIDITDFKNPENVRLKRVKRIWMCKP
jgi:hypothetical protein